MADVRFLGCDQDAFCAVWPGTSASLRRLQVTGSMSRLIDNDEYFTNKLAPYLDGEDPADVYMSGPVLMWEQLGAGRVEPLDPFLSAPAPTTTPMTSLPAS